MRSIKVASLVICAVAIVPLTTRSIRSTTGSALAISSGRAASMVSRVEWMIVMTLGPLPG